MSSEFKFFCKSLQIQHIMLLYHPRSNRQAECFVDIFKRALKKSEGEESDEKRLKQFQNVFRITPNLNTRSGILLVELMFTRKIKSMFNKILTEWKAQTSRNIPINKYLNLQEKVFFKTYQEGKEFWKDSVVKKKKGSVE